MLLTPSGKGANNMNYDNLKKKMDEVNKREIPEEIRQKIEDDFEVEYTYDTLALSGSSLTKDEVRAILAALRKQNGGNK